MHQLARPSPAGPFREAAAAGPKYIIGSFAFPQGNCLLLSPRKVERGKGRGKGGEGMRMSWGRVRNSLLRCWGPPQHRFSARCWGPASLGNSDGHTER